MTEETTTTTTPALTDEQKIEKAKETLDPQFKQFLDFIGHWSGQPLIQLFVLPNNEQDQIIRAMRATITKNRTHYIKKLNEAAEKAEEDAILMMVYPGRDIRTLTPAERAEGMIKAMRKDAATEGAAPAATPTPAPAAAPAEQGSDVAPSGASGTA